MTRSTLNGLAVFLFCSATGPTLAQVLFEYSKGPGLLALEISDPDKALAIMTGMGTAGSIWGGILADPITVKIKVDYDPGLSSIGSTSGGAYGTGIDYPDIKTALFLNASSPFDFTSIGSLQPGPLLTLRVNNTNPMPPPPPFPPPPPPTYGPYINTGSTAINEALWINNANAKALGLLAPTAGGDGADGTIKWGAADFDFVYTNGIEPTKKDFVGSALHELGHALGFYSGADFTGPMISAGAAEEDTWMLNVLDLFRYSTVSATAGPFVPDISIPTSPVAPERFLSIDGGVTPLALFSTGSVLLGDGKTASHWKDDSLAAGFWTGLMDPTLGDGFALTEMFLASLTGPPTPDEIAFDVIGYTLVPAPSAAAPLVLGCLIIARRRRD